MDSNFKCGYCRWYTKGKSFKDGDSVIRECIPLSKRVGFVSATCEYFSPKESFFCEKYGDRVAIPICLHRRFNEEKLMHYLYCKKCRQFSRDIKGIADIYFLNAKKIKKVKEEEEEYELPETRTLKRRKEKPEKRKLKRRSKPEVKPARRKLKRRIKHGK